MKKLLILFILIPVFIYSQVQIGTDIDGETALDQSGRSVSLSSDGSAVAIGAIYNNDNGINTGHVRVYKNIGGIWTQLGTDIDGEVTDELSGKSVSLSSDGLIVAIGAPNDFGGGSDPSYVRIYKYIEGNWIQLGTDINNEADGDSLGASVSLSSDGSIVAIGAYTNAGNCTNSGHVRIYKNIGGIWTQIGTDIDGEAADDLSGASISLSSDGSIVAIGAYANDGNGINSGHVRVYENVGGIWIQLGTDINGEAAGDLSGYSVSLSSDGSSIAVGAISNDGNGISSGHVRVYKNIGGIWTQFSTDINGESGSSSSGYSVSLSSDGSVVAIGTPYNDGNGDRLGHARIYDLSTLLANNEFVTSDFSLYPNPTKTQFTIQLDNSNVLENVKIYNNLGQLVLTSQKQIVNTSTLGAGLYVVELETTKGKGSKKLIIE